MVVLGSVMCWWQWPALGGLQAAVACCGVGVQLPTCQQKQGATLDFAHMQAASLMHVWLFTHLHYHNLSHPFAAGTNAVLVVHLHDSGTG